jgi:hypothetical protein
MSMFWLCINLKGLVLVDGADIGAAGISEQLEAKNLVEQVVGNTTKLPQVEKLPPMGGRTAAQRANVPKPSGPPTRETS